jgi:hypothetical protein
MVAYPRSSEQVDIQVCKVLAFHIRVDTFNPSAFDEFLPYEACFHDARPLLPDQVVTCVEHLCAFSKSESQKTRCVRLRHALLTCCFRHRRREGVIGHFRIIGWVELANKAGTNVEPTMKAFKQWSEGHVRLAQIINTKCLAQSGCCSQNTHLLDYAYVRPISLGISQCVKIRLFTGPRAPGNLGVSRNELAIEWHRSSGRQ